MDLYFDKQHIKTIDLAPIHNIGYLKKSIDAWLRPQQIGYTIEIYKWDNTKLDDIYFTTNTYDDYNLYEDPQMYGGRILITSLPWLEIEKEVESIFGDNSYRIMDYVKSKPHETEVTLKSTFGKDIGGKIMEYAKSDFYYDLNEYARSKIPSFPTILSSYLIEGEEGYYVYVLNCVNNKRYGFAIYDNTYYSSCNPMPEHYRLYPEYRRKYRCVDFYFPTFGPVVDIGKHCFRKFVDKFNEKYTNRVPRTYTYDIPGVGTFEIGSSGAVADVISNIFNDPKNSIIYYINTIHDVKPGNFIHFLDEAR